MSMNSLDHVEAASGCDDGCVLGVRSDSERYIGHGITLDDDNASASTSLPRSSAAKKKFMVTQIRTGPAYSSAAD